MCYPIWLKMNLAATPRSPRLNAKAFWSYSVEKTKSNILCALETTFKFIRRMLIKKSFVVFIKIRRGFFQIVLQLATYVQHLMLSRVDTLYTY